MAWLKTHASALLLLPWIGLLLGLLLSGAYLDYVADWHLYLQIIALALLCFTFIGEVIRASLAQAQLHEPGCGHEHHAHGSPVRPGLVLAHLVPMIMLLAVGSPQLGLEPDLESSMAYESSALIKPPAASKPKFTEDGYENTDIMRLHLGYKENKTLPAKVAMLGQIYRMSDNELQKDAAGLRDKGVESYLFRFLMVCCAADARPLSVGLLFEKPMQVDQQAWIEVKGQPVIIEGASKFIVLKVHELKQVPKPPDPYLFSLF